MDATRFEELIDAYGARLERWPEVEREAARAYAMASPETSRLLAEALTLDQALDAWTLPPESAALRETIVSAAPGPRARAFVLRPIRLWWAGAGLAAACAMGMVVGANLDRAGLLTTPTTDSGTALLSTSDSLTVFGATLDTGKSS